MYLELYLNLSGLRTTNTSPKFNCFWTAGKLLNLKLEEVRCLVEQ